MAAGDRGCRVYTLHEMFTPPSPRAPLPPTPGRFFPLLKSNDKLYAQDQIWKKICRDLQWEFIPSL